MKHFKSAAAVCLVYAAALTVFSALLGREHPYCALLLADTAALGILFAWARRSFPDAAGCVPLRGWSYPVYLLAGAALNLLFGLFPQDAVMQSAEPIPVQIAAILIAPLAEETVFRGMMHGELRAILPAWCTALLTAALFALTHTGRQILPMLLFGLLLSLIRERENSVLAPLFVHEGFNLVSLLLFL